MGRNYSQVVQIVSIHDFCKNLPKVSGEFIAFSPWCLNSAITTSVLQV